MPNHTSRTRKGCTQATISKVKVQLTFQLAHPFVFEDGGWKKMKWKEPHMWKLEWQDSWQLAEHARLSSDLFLAVKREPLTALGYLQQGLSFCIRDVKGEREISLLFFKLFYAVTVFMPADFDNFKNARHYYCSCFYVVVIISIVYKETPHLQHPQKPSIILWTQKRDGSW